MYSLSFQTYWPKTVNFYYKAEDGDDDSFSLSITDVENLPTFQDVIDYMVKLYNKGYEELSKIIQHNKAVMAKMNEIASVWKISKSLKQ